jgi:hypothetical protein
MYKSKLRLNIACTVGIDTPVDMNTIEAGVISQIGQAILRRSLDLYISFADYVEKFQDQK